jgi:hypothetical protein
VDAERGKLFEAFRPLARSRAKLFLWSGHSLQELTSVASVGLGCAVRGYDPQSKNGLAAYAIPWIDGELKDFVTKAQSLVIGERIERGKYLPRASAVNHFGNVGLGDGEVTRDASLHMQVSGVSDDGDDENGFGDDVISDHSLEAISGEHFEKRLKAFKRSGGWLQVRWTLSGWEWLGDARLDHDAKLFLREYRECVMRGIGYLYRDRRTENKCLREILPFAPSARPHAMLRLADKQTWIFVSALEKHTKLAPNWDGWRLRSFERMERAAYVSDAERKASQPT